MPTLLSGSTLRTGGSGDFIDLKDAMPQLPATETTLTGFTIVTDSVLRTSYRSSLGFIEFNSATMVSSLPDGTIRVLATGTSFASTSTTSGVLVIEGGVGVGAGMFIRDDINVNGITIGQGYQGLNNISIIGKASPQTDDFNNGQENVVIGYDALTGINTAYKSIAIGRYALNSGTYISNSIAIGDSTLKSIGTTPTWLVKPISGVSITPSKPITNITNATPAVVTVTGHGLTSGNRISIYDVIGLTTGTNSLVNDKSFWVSTLSNDTFALYNNPSLSTSSALSTQLTDCSLYSSSGTLVYPITLTVPDTNYSEGTAVLLESMVGLSELNFTSVYVLPLTTTTYQLYYDTILEAGIDGTSLTPYVNSGTATRVLFKKNNIAVGTNAGTKLYDGERNFFFGDAVATNLTTGSNNFMMGHEVANNLTQGSGIISIMGDNLVDGVDNQINIGGIFYYNGTGLLQLSTDTKVGLGTPATSSIIAAMSVLGGLGVTENAIIDGQVIITAGISSTLTTNGSLVISGGVGISESVNIGNKLVVVGTGQVTLSPAGADVVISPSSSGTVTIFPNSTGTMNNVVIGNIVPQDGNFVNLNSNIVTAASTSNSFGTTSGALVVTGGVGIGKDLWVGGAIYGSVDSTNNLSGGAAGTLVYQSSTGTTTYLGIGATGEVLLSDGSVPFWGFNAGAANTSTVAEQILIHPVDPSTPYYLTLAEHLSVYSRLDADTALTYDTTNNVLTTPKLLVSSTASSTSTTTSQAIVVNGGIGVKGNVYVVNNIYSKGGNPDENNLLYTPTVTISTTAPTAPRVGDFWIDPTYGVELQWVKDGTSTFWIQFAGF